MTAAWLISLDFIQLRRKALSLTRMQNLYSFSIVLGSYLNLVVFSKRPKWTEAVLQLTSSFVQQRVMQVWVHFVWMGLKLIFKIHMLMHRLEVTFSIGIMLLARILKSRITLILLLCWTKYGLSLFLLL